jgi:hypothetical protein
LIELNQPRRFIVQLPQIQPQRIVINAPEHWNRQRSQGHFQRVQLPSAKTFGRVRPQA